MWASNSTPGHLFQINENVCPHKSLCINTVTLRVTANGRSIWISFTKRMDSQARVQSQPDPCKRVSHSVMSDSLWQYGLQLTGARILAWASILFSRGSSWPRDQTWVPRITGRFFTTWVTREVKADPCSSVKRPEFHQRDTQLGWISETLYRVKAASVGIIVGPRLYSSDILKQAKPWWWRRDHTAEGQGEEKTQWWRGRERDSQDAWYNSPVSWLR